MDRNRGEKALLVGAGLAVVGSLFYAGYPEEVAHARKTIQEYFSPDDTQAEGSESDCIAIENVPLATQIGAMILPMAEATRLDVLEGMMVAYDISNFTLLGHPEDTVIYHGVPTAFAEATNSIVTATAAANQVRTTFALDEEGGTVQRVDNLENGAHILPSAQEMALKTPEEITAIFRAHGDYLASIGVTTVFGPVTDVGTQAADGSRSFSDDPAVMARSAIAVIEGLRAAGIQATIKHLPDYGQSQGDSDEGPTSVPPIAELEAYSIPSIAQVIQEGQPTYAMMGNYVSAGLSDTIPASLSPAAYAYVEDVMGFQGVLMTDALNAGSIVNYEGLGIIPSQAKAAVEAIAAGADIVIIHLDATESVVQSINDALKTGALSLPRINDASIKALEAKGYDMC